MRGIGPARQSAPFNLLKLMRIPRSCTPLVELGPCNPMHMTILACVFMLREVEVATALVSSWTLSESDQEITWLLPGSKSDHMALGVRRSWPCLCGLDTMPCPFHLAKDHLQWLCASEFSSEPDAPLFPTIRGKMASKAHVVGTFDKLAEATGEPLLNEDGCRRFGGHTPRVTGARHYATHGVEISKIRLIARHSGETIMRYVLDAPLQSIRADLGLSPQGTKLMPYASTQC